MSWIGCLDRFCGRIENVLLGTAASIMLAMMLITGIDVIARYVFHAPVSWAFDLLTNYLLIASFFLSFSYTLRIHEHVAVDYFISRWNPRVLRIGLSLGYLLSAMLVAYIAALASHETWGAWQNKEVIAGAIEWPVWVARLVVPLGMVPLALRLLLLALRTFLPGDASRIQPVQPAEQ